MACRRFASPICKAASPAASNFLSPPTSYPYVNREYDTTKFRYGYQSFITPPSVYEYDMTNGTSTFLKQKEVPGGYDRNRYEVERIYATASDGVKIPISVVHLKSAKMDVTGPVYLTGYGSYGIPTTSASIPTSSA